ncbi:hypothetical protein A3D77_02275 [Candidatus Gottesmanbacteria bacterium RIFCSPHIGHO2_02_FULL_39_11]|uniref:Purine nucleoside phosphorylase n=1 Tax=Candidatus Gottesmanbacteria bacterium RIFCSPHIGHO2_02_FULL_39_11 TaxID=1798382 RepID=A0A1F5ZV64_9BACT|nr:MAG: hypothetical protein A3D77_02275 [Candidatus Gottesmanbacteria bacterium RIFCSPHIGHO2_02_FULL_39_11]
MIQSELIKKFPEFFHAFLSKGESLSSLNIKGSESNFIHLRQIHSGNVVLENSKTNPLNGTDGIILKGKGWSGVKTADCIPIFLYDPKLKIAGAVHAGWKGLSKKIVTSTIQMMKKIGSHPQNIYAAIGPHIRICCYDVPQERVSIFCHLGFLKNEISEERGGKWFLNLESIALKQMKDERLLRSNIDCLSICTYTNKNLWSYRREGLQPNILNNIIGFI